MDRTGRPLTSSFRLLTSRTVLPPAETPGIPTRPAAAAAAAAAAFGMARGLRAPGTAATGSPNFKIKRILRHTHKSFTNTNLSPKAAGLRAALLVVPERESCDTEKGWLTGSRYRSSWLQGHRELLELKYMLYYVNKLNYRVSYGKAKEHKERNTFKSRHSCPWVTASSHIYKTTFPARATHCLHRAVFMSSHLKPNQSAQLMKPAGAGSPVLSIRFFQREA